MCKYTPEHYEVRFRKQVARPCPEATTGGTLAAAAAAAGGAAGP